MKGITQRLLVYVFIVTVLIGSAYCNALSHNILAVDDGPSLLITEIVAKSAGSGQPYEYVEIYNNTSSDLSLEGYELQYFTSNNSNPSNRWKISTKTIKARDTMVLWLKKYDYPKVPFWDFNTNYNSQLTREHIVELKLTTSAQGLHDSSLRKVAIAGPDGVPISTALFNNGEVDGITNRSVNYQNSNSSEMTKLRNNEQASPAKVVTGQLSGLETPTGVTATPQNKAIKVEWNPIEGATAYHIYSSSNPQPVKVLGEHSYIFQGLVNNREYSYRITSIDRDGNESSGSLEVKAIPQEVVDHVPPAVPNGLKATSGEVDIQLKWNKNTDSDFAGYRIFINGTLYDSTSSESILISPLELGREYTFEVTAYDAFGNESDKSQAFVSGPSKKVPIPDLLITETVPNTDNYASYDAFEYLEIYNNSNKTIDLKGYRIQSGNWNEEIKESLVVEPWTTQLFWTRRQEISPIIREAFNYNYFSSYESKFLNVNQLYILENIGGFANSGTQSIRVVDPSGREVVNAGYEGQDVFLKKSIAFNYPQDGSITMEKAADPQVPTPGFVGANQVPARPVVDEIAPIVPSGVTAQAGAGKILLSWEPNKENDIYRYHIYKNGSLEFSVPPLINKFSLSSLIGNKTYAIEVAAEDISGNVSGRSKIIEVIPTHQLITQEERSPHIKDPKYQGLWDISSDGPIIPGLAQDLVPQGITYYKKKDWLLTVNYLDDGRPGTLTVTNATTEQLVKSVLLYNPDGTPYTGHAGGITVSRDHLWIASEQFLFPLKISDLVNAKNNDEIRFINQIPLPVEAAYNVYDEGILWVGEFYEKTDYPTDPSHHLLNREGKMHYAWMVGYDLERNNDMLSKQHWNGDPNQTATPDYVLSTTEKVQGAIVQKKGITLSTSYGRGNDSVLYRYEYPLKEEAHTSVQINGKQLPLWFLDGASSKPRESIEAIPMPEGIVEEQKELFVLFESGANKYRYTTTFPMERILKIDLKRLMKDDKIIDR
ncbi:lamin tail domain-containing protein [Fictibacillus phosphorivorans]|uniref:lamin tail domain-containing protein n=1 Tax=Fictibacillus phosphorivorans TaxID=1221500 RepID=UPI00129351A1|nr:lamin tail domain-containing protein [Fictibacillus phosphorivorans]MQR94098.1 hypothetical protein [Fictibacillus phosphorivorans]